jgi:predicted transposase YdaD
MFIEINPEETYLFKKGEEKGEKRGEKNKGDKMILAMLKLEKLSVDEIAKIANVSIDYVKKLASNLNN